LFLLAAFLLAPALTFLFALLVLVILVLETMISPLYLKIFNFYFISTHSRNKFLPTLGQVVKVLILNYLIIVSPKALSSCKNDTTNIHHINIAVGEYYRIPTPNLANYAVSNKELLSVRHRKAQEGLLIRGKHQGFSTIKVWNSHQVEKKYHIFIQTKIGLAKMKLLALSFEQMGIDTELSSSKLKLCSTITELNQFKSISSLLKSSEKSINIDNQLLISKELQRELANLIYPKFLKNKVSDIICQFHQMPIRCKVPKSNLDIDSLVKYWFHEIPIEIHQFQDELTLDNFKLKTKLILLESASSEVLALGLDKISNNLYALIRNDLNSFIGENIINFENKRVKLSSIATPEIITRVNNEGEISIGSEIPFTRKSKEEYVTNWKFAGLKIKTKLEKENNEYFLNIETELSRPMQSSGASTISSNKTKSRVKITQGKSLKITDIGHQGIQHQNTSLPYLSKIPLLGKLFTSSSEIETYKNIQLYVQLERMP